ncbi:MAG: serine hydrolase domain-containing protein [Fimbriimonas sp.]
MAGYVDRGEISGIVTVVSRRGESHFDAIGHKAFEPQTPHYGPMRRDSIFRIASMTKPVVAAAAMILVEECRLRLDDPVERFLPELADRNVLRSLDGAIDDTVPAHRPINLRDILTFRLGYGMVLAPPGTYPIQQAMDDLNLGQGGPPGESLPEPDEWIRRLGTLPLLHQPGERWMYNTGSDVLGVLIARASGQSLDAFLQERLFGPLGMKDTAFSVPADKLDRFATSYDTNWQSGERQIYDPAVGGKWSEPPTFPAGGGGLVSTADDFLAFGRMMLNGGKHGRERILSRLSVEAMTTNQLTPDQRVGTELFLQNRGWGFGVGVVQERDATAAIPGRFGWDGGLGTSWSSDPKEELVGVLLTQQSWTSPTPPPVCQDFWTCAYGAIGD